MCLAAERRGLAWVVIAVTAVADQVSKLVLLSALSDAPRALEVIPGLLFFRLKVNTGVAFSLFAGFPFALTIITTVAILVIGWWAWSVPRSDRLTRFTFGLILGGALGNLIDRYTRGHVVDFIDFRFPGFLGDWHTRFFGTPHFATFNVADSAICVGMGLLILAIFLHRHDETEEANP